MQPRSVRWTPARSCQMGIGTSDARWNSVIWQIFCQQSCNLETCCQIDVNSQMLARLTAPCVIDEGPFHQHPTTRPSQRGVLPVASFCSARDRLFKTSPGHVHARSMYWAFGALTWDDLDRAHKCLGVSVECRDDVRITQGMTRAIEQPRDYTTDHAANPCSLLHHTLRLPSQQDDSGFA